MRTNTRELLAVGIFGSASRLGERIEMVLKRGREFSPRASLTWVAASILALMGMVVAGSLAPRWIAFAQEPPNPPRPTGQVDRPVPPGVVPPARPERAVLIPPQVAREADSSLQTALNFYGYGNLSGSEIARLRRSGITADYISRMMRSGLGRPGRRPTVPLDQLVQLSAAGVTPDDAEIAARAGFPTDLFLAFHEIGFPHLDPNQITEAAMQGLHPENVRRAKAFGQSLTLEEIIHLRDEHKLDQNEAERLNAN